jgi:phosphatidylinositol alpha 1,6-mannosyltransferase
MDVFVHYGQEETFGQTIQEAQAAGAVVIAPEAGGPKFLIESGVSGYLMNAKKVGVYKEQLLQVMADSELRARIGEGGRRSVLNKSWKENNNRLFELYMTAITHSTTEEVEQLQIA